MTFSAILVALWSSFQFVTVQLVNHIQGRTRGFCPWWSVKKELLVEHNLAVTASYIKNSSHPTGVQLPATPVSSDEDVGNLFNFFGCQCQGQYNFLFLLLLPGTSQAIVNY